jgi:hypothetical protein
LTPFSELIFQVAGQIVDDKGIPVTEISNIVLLGLQQFFQVLLAYLFCHLLFSLG